MEMKPGSRWKSAVCTTEVVIVRPPAAPVVLECGGLPMGIEAAGGGGAPAADRAAGSRLGKRYTDEVCGIEVLCTKAGAGTLAVDGRSLTVKDAKRLPSSD